MTFYPEDRQIQAERAMDRARALTVRCPYCDAAVGEECASNRGLVLAKQPAHFRRLQDAGGG